MTITSRRDANVGKSRVDTKVCERDVSSRNGETVSERARGVEGGRGGGREGGILRARTDLADEQTARGC